MGKKRKFNRFIRWIKSDLPDDNKSVLLLGVTKIPSSPTPTPRARPHTLHLDHHLSAKSQTLDSLPRSKPRLFRSRSKDSLNELLTNRSPEANFKRETNSSKLTANPSTTYQLNPPNHIYHPDTKSSSASNNYQLNYAKKEALNTDAKDGKYTKKVSFNTNNLKLRAGDCFSNEAANNRLGFCTELPYELYHPCAYENQQVNDSFIPDIVMDKSVDSIGSCSLDVDASSTDFSDSSVGSSDCTLRSLGVPFPTTQPSSATVPTFRLEPSAWTDVIEPKKPSYLNLACTVNGYSNITNYDSKLRENFRTPRSREVSPIRPQDYHANIVNQPNGEQSKYLTPNYSRTLLATTSPNMADSKAQTILRSTGFSYSSTSSKSVSYISNESRNFTSSMLYSSNSDSDTVDNASYNQKTNGFQSKNYESFMKSSNNSYNINGKSSSMSDASMAENYTNGTSSKSFIQQRVERLYGPGALAQGFFITKRTKSRLSESENVDNSPSTTNGSVIPTPAVDSIESKENDLNLKQSCSSPSLPVLRHLRPEFRAQLPILFPKRIFNDNAMQKSTTVPSSLVAATNGHETKLLNGSKTVASFTENKENIEEPLIIDEKLLAKQPLIAQKIEDLNTVKIITEEIPAAPQVILPIQKSEIALNGNEAIVMNGEKIKPDVKDGHYFLNILKNETDRLILLAEKAEVWLEEEKTVLNDDMLGHLRSASGKARLLVTQKMQQFEGLCHKNINQIPGEPFPTTAEDLQGFWDMVMLQVTQVDDLFEELDLLKANNWVIKEKPKPDTDVTKPKKVLVVKKAVSANTEAQRKQREATRKKMIEEKRKAMRNKQSQPEQVIEMFVPESS